MGFIYLRSSQTSILIVRVTEPKHHIWGKLTCILVYSYGESILHKRHKQCACYKVPQTNHTKEQGGKRKTTTK